MTRYNDPLWTPTKRESRNQPAVQTQEYYLLGQKVRKRFQRFQGQQMGIRPGFPDMKEVMRRKREIRSTGPYTYQPVRRRLKNFRGATVFWKGPFKQKDLLRVVAEAPRIINIKSKIGTKVQTMPRVKRRLGRLSIGEFGFFRVDLLR